MSDRVMQPLPADWRSQAFFGLREQEDAPTWTETFNARPFVGVAG